MDHDINTILTRMFGTKFMEAKYQKYGWFNKENDKTEKSKK